MSRPFTDSAGIADDGAALRARIERDGFLFLPGLLPRTAVLEARAAMIAVLAEAGWLDPRHDPDRAIPDMDRFCVEPEPAFMQVYYRELSQKSLNALQHHPALVGLFERMLGGPVLPHPRITARNIFPHREDFTTPAHQDYVAIQGTPDHFAAWIPLGDCGPEMGGLELAVGSNRHGIYDMRPSLGAGQLEIIADEAFDWAYSPCACGDVIVHSAMTVHRGVPNRSDRFRLSMDYRYQRVDEPVCVRSLNPSHQLASWDELYRGWADDANKYYWRGLPLQVVDYDYQYFDRRDEMAISMGHAGDVRARTCLEGIVQKHRDPSMRARAKESLTALLAS